MSFTDDILIMLSSYAEGYALMRKVIRGSYPQKYITRDQLDGYKGHINIKERTARVILSRLKKRGLTENDSGFWKITQNGREYLKNRIKYFSSIPKAVSRNMTRRHSESKIKNIIIIFDIPESIRKSRDWLRNELLLLDFEQLQKSVWLGPAPLPKEFIESLEELNILRYVKFFKATEHEIV